MEDSDTVSNFSSIADAPDHLQTQYDPLGGVFKVYPHLLPSAKPPESNSDAMIRALKALQEKIRHLEVERVSAANRLSHLERKTAQSPKHRPTEPAPSTSSVGVGGTGIGLKPQPPIAQPSLVGRQLAQDQQDLQTRLESIDKKYSQQAHELREMRRQFEEQSSKSSPPGYDTVDAPYTSPGDKGRQSTPEKSRGSSRERRTRSESPIQMKMPSKRKKVRNTRKSSQKKQARPLQLCQLPGGKPQPGVHYRLDMKDVPFVAGTSLSPSHSVAANYQRVVSLMKSHGPLCGAVTASSSRKLKRQRYTTTASQRRTIPPPPPGVSLTELEVLLAGLEEELGELTFKHQQLALKVGSQPVKIRGQLQQLVDDLEAKAMQIDIVQRQIESMKSQRTGKRASTGHKTKTMQTKSMVVEEDADTESRGDFLRRMKSLQNTLQSDDLTWK